MQAEWVDGLVLPPFNETDDAVVEVMKSGKPVVCVDLSEVAQFGGLVHKAADHADFVAKVGSALAEPAGGEEDTPRSQMNLQFSVVRD